MTIGSLSQTAGAALQQVLCDSPDNLYEGCVHVVELEKRESGLAKLLHFHPYIPPYGKSILWFSLAYLVYRELALYLYSWRWKQTGRSTTMLKWSTIPWWAATILFTVVSVGYSCMGYYNYVDPIKRTGRIAFALTPIDIVFGMRPFPLGIDHYLDLLVLHKWISRLIILLVSFHSLGFLYVWGPQVKSALSRPVNYYGFIVFVASFLLFFVSWAPVRHFYYKYWYLFHQITVLLWVVLTAYHARPGVQVELYVSGVIWIWQLILRYKSIRTIQLTDMVSADNSDMKIIRFSRKYLPDSALPGCHSRLGLPIKNFGYWLFPTHPYTLAAIDDGSEDISVIIKECRFHFQLETDYCLQPYFASSLSKNFFDTAENVNIVCGGSGISYGIPVFKYFQKRAANRESSICIRLIWITRFKEDLFLLRELDVQGVRVYITRGTRPEGALDVNDTAAASTFTLESGDSSAESLAPLNSESDDLRLEDPVQTVKPEQPIEPAHSMDLSDLASVPPRESEEIELETLDADGESNPFEDPHIDTENEIHWGGRPNLEEALISNLDATIDYANKWVISCGPFAMMDEAKAVAKKHKCRFFAEEYAM